MWNGCVSAHCEQTQTHQVGAPDGSRKEASKRYPMGVVKDGGSRQDELSTQRVELVGRVELLHVLLRKLID